jgi:hypothetical protein
VRNEASGMGGPASKRSQPGASVPLFSKPLHVSNHGSGCPGCHRTFFRWTVTRAPGIIGTEPLGRTPRRPR